MTKSDLRTGHVVTLRNGEMHEVYINAISSTCRNGEYCNIITDGHTWSDLNSYNEDLTCKYASERDIVKIQCVQTKTDLHPIDGRGYCLGDVLWGCKEKKKKMTVTEIESILGYGIEIVSDK